MEKELEDWISRAVCTVYFFKETISRSWYTRLLFSTSLNLEWDAESRGGLGPVQETSEV